MSRKATGGRRAVFLDRDGVLNALVDRDGQQSSPRRAVDFRVLPGVREAVQSLRDLGFLVFVVSNQPDVSRGMLAREELDAMTALLRRAAVLDDVMVCPHDDPDGCTCRKPKPGMLIELAERWGVDLRTSYMIGDTPKDIGAGVAAGCRTIQIGASTGCAVSPWRSVSVLSEAVAYIAADL
ncbi:MAG: D-glycero-alpha-D-manno-heptose-1,7-bisphosphate 7-phosphatase [Candidatus Binatia bacterium]